MLPRAALFLTIFIVLLKDETFSFKTLQELKKQYKKVENDDFSTSDHLVGKAMDFIYSNRTFMSLIARELWNVGSKAIDKIVDLKVDSRRPRLRADATKPRSDYRPSDWLANSAMDVWYGNKSILDILSGEFKDILDRIAMRPVRTSLQNYKLGN